MEVLYGICGGVDVRKRLLVVCLRSGRKSEIQEYGTTTRELVRHRKSLVKDKSRELNRLQKMLEGGNIKLSGTVSEIDGKSARNILSRIVEGETIDGKVYDEMYAKTRAVGKEDLPLFKPPRKAL